ncbi:MAG: hypothetical protein AB7P99_16430 [Vicinamibacterales bacterium]
MAVQLLRNKRKTLRGASGHPGLALAKGPTRAQRAADDKAAEVAQIRLTYRYVSLRDTRWGGCRRCQGLLCGNRNLQMNEWPPRSKTRGLPPQERFNAIVCHMLGERCHQDVTEGRITPVGNSDVRTGRADALQFVPGRPRCRS